MSKLFITIFEFFTNSKVHANYSYIKGKKSGGTRDGNNKGWKNPHQSNPTN